MAQGVLILGVTRGEEGLEQALDMAHFLQAVGHFRQSLNNQRLDIFTDGQVSRAERQQGPHIIERKPGSLCGPDEANDLEGLPGIEPILVLRPRGGVHQSRAFVVAQRGCWHPRCVRQLTNRVLLVHDGKPLITRDIAHVR